jgi:type IV secretion system protein TrbL
MGIIISSFVELGIKAGGDEITADVFFSPASIASLGMNYWQHFAQSIDALTGPIAFFENIVPISILFLTGLIVIAAFFVMALQVFVTIVMFKLVTLAAFVLVPFGLLKHTNFMSERALGLVVSYGLKFLTLALIISIGYSVFSELQPSVPMSLGEAFSLCLAALALMMLALHAPAVASELITGGPQLGAGAMGASIAGASALGAGAAYLGGRAAFGAGQMAANPLIRAAGAGNITINGQPMSSANSPSSLSSSSTPTFHSQSGQGQGNKGGAPKSSGLGKGTIAGGAATSSMARNDSSGGISSTHSNHQDEGE